MALELSVIVPTYNRREPLLAKLHWLEAQTLSPQRFEVVVTVDGSTDGTAQALNQLSLPYRLVVVEQENRGRGAARNAAIGAAQGEFLVFSDDDVLPHERLLEEHVKAQRHFGGAAVVGLKDVMGTRSHWAAGTRLPWIRFATGNASAPRAAVQQVGGFVEWQGYGGEDLELGYKLWRAGLSIRSWPAAIGYHAPPPPEEWRAKAYSAGRNAWQLYCHHPHWQVAVWLGVHPLLLWFKGLVLRPSRSAQYSQRLTVQQNHWWLGWQAQYVWEFEYFQGARSARLEGATASRKG
ncbi:MAG: glycosyltransferase [Deinococcus sp.]|nr:glycosyltransferase [Deinococcus sp.]